MATKIIIKKKVPRDPLVSHMRRRTGKGPHKTHKDIPRSTQKQKIKREIENDSLN